MKIIVLAAGQGSRMMPLTKNLPKCMVSFLNKPLLEYTLDMLNNMDVTVVTGSHADAIPYNVNKIHNEKYLTTTMVDSLFLALEEDENEDVIVSYSDIIFKPWVLQKLVDDPNKFSVVVDRNWLDLWRIRSSDPLSDAETLAVKSNVIEQIGGKPTDLSQIEGQYIGLFKLHKSVISSFKKVYIESNPIHMTQLMQNCINTGMKISSVWIDGGWMEFDTTSDLQLIEYWKRFD